MGEWKRMGGERGRERGRGLRGEGAREGERKDIDERRRPTSNNIFPSKPHLK